MKTKPPDPDTVSNPLHSLSDGDACGEERTLDDVLESLPLGWYHYRLLIICGLSFMADGMEVSLLSFISTCAGIEWGLGDSERALITSIVFAGELIGSICFGPIADNFGRRVAFMIGCSLITVLGIMSGMSPNYTFLLVCRAIVGFGVGGVTVPFDLLAEFLPNQHRGRFLIYIEAFWTFGSMFVAAAAWIFLPTGGWRMLTLITAIPVTLSCIAAILYLPESPRWLVVRGKTERAAEIVRHAAAVNCISLPPFRLKGDSVPEEYVPLTSFLKPDQRSLSIPLWTVWACFGFTYYGVIMFVARIFGSSESSSSCEFNYQAIFVSAASELGGVILTALLIDRCGRVGTQAGMYAVAGAGMLCMGITMPPPPLSVFSILARLAIMGASSATWVATPELFPTHLRATGHAVASSVARVGAFLAPFLVDHDAAPNILIGAILAGVNIIAMLSTFMLPETSGKHLDDTKMTKRNAEKPQRLIDKANARVIFAIESSEHSAVSQEGHSTCENADIEEISSNEAYRDSG